LYRSTYAASVLLNFVVGDDEAVGDYSTTMQRQRVHQNVDLWSKDTRWPVRGFFRVDGVAVMTTSSINVVWKNMEEFLLLLLLLLYLLLILVLSPGKQKQRMYASIVVTSFVPGEGEDGGDRPSVAAIAVVVAAAINVTVSTIAVPSLVVVVATMISFVDAN